MSELINKQSLLNTIEGLSCVGFLHTDDLLDAVRWMPVIEQRKKGRWLNKGRKICCSECGHVNFCKPNFCDECGTDMRKEKTE